MAKVGTSTSGREDAPSVSVTIFSTDSRTSCSDASAITTDRMMMETGSSFVRPVSRRNSKLAWYKITGLQKKIFKEKFT